MLKLKNALIIMSLLSLMIVSKTWASVADAQFPSLSFEQANPALEGIARSQKAFKQEAIRLALTDGKSIAETARNLGIKEATLYNWVSQFKHSQTKIPSEEFSNPAELVDELTRLCKENARLKEEREILKKAAAFFAKEEQKR